MWAGFDTADQFEGDPTAVSTELVVGDCPVVVIEVTGWGSLKKTFLSGFWVGIW